ncbi:hypothetical protein HAZELMIKA_70 [Klebsiella phage vB_KaeD_HazelMika]|nr:hypothetical protein HAZELMIKA_70 [Klebsiella phage vB_KaeD_HazelMika]
MKNLQLVRLLNPSIYASRDPKVFRKGDLDDQSVYPVVVEADVFKAESFSFAAVSAKELDRVFPIMSCNGEQYERSGSLHFWNDPETVGENIQRVSWEPVTPFDYWNKLKSSRPVGDVVPQGYL